MRKALFLFVVVLVIGNTINYSSAAVILPPTHTKIDPSKVKEAVAELKGLSKKERKNRLKAAMKEIKAFKAAKKAGKEPDTNTLLLVIIALLLPPLAVYLHEGEANNKFWITLLLFVLGVIGGFIFSWFLLLAAIVYALIIVLSGSV
jgi:uncharacterized membrane protein YqaE (UPF0057 family)